MEIEINEKTTTADLEQIIKYFRQPIYGSPFGIKGRMNRKAYFLYSFLYAFFISFIPTFFLTLLSSLLFKLKIIDVQRVMLFPMYATLLTYPLIFWIYSMLTIKRLHDLNLSGLWYSIWCIWALI